MSTFPLSERLKSRKIIEDVYDNGKQINHFPFRLKYLLADFEDGANVKIAIAVPKRKVKKAVKRNRIKRQIREAYRLNKSDLLSKFEGKEKGLALFLVYTGEQDQNYQWLEKKLVDLLKKLQSNL
ncbi:ribonuclease P protein component [Paracrocinitomix mangrovi]|uniref:ribonuclease P protein component n=1 Tax=Paracrocinitomix mangrovi TaxID=2862509 RepID=UPI001C8EB39A|nr:ribonuclease P protein component [Paracrocinitomix mangrovi]UKN00358.1 ribonuclease P protein component [Paracrocinitomix mangrovi]